MCEFNMINLQDVNNVPFAAVVEGQTVDVSYDGEEFEIMSVVIMVGSITTVTFTVPQQNPPIQAEGRHWCRDDDDPWVQWTEDSGKLSYTTQVPTKENDTTGYEFRFALKSAVKEAADQNKPVLWVDPKVIISRKGQGATAQQYAAR